MVQGVQGGRISFKGLLCTVAKKRKKPLDCSEKQFFWEKQRSH